MSRQTALELIDLVFDRDSWESWNHDLIDPIATGSYAAELAMAREKTGVDESVIVGTALLRGNRVALLACEFGFLAGSIGIAAGRRLVAAIERATASRLPLIALPVSGGTRMQEGATAFLQMVNITVAVTAHKAAKLPYLVYLRNPTTGGVFASWGSLGHITVAEPGALIGFIGPRVYEALHGEPFPPDVQTAENLQACRLVDGVLPPEQLTEFFDRALRIMTSRKELEKRISTVVMADSPRASSWEAVLASRRPGRPGVRELLSVAADDVLPLYGYGKGPKDSGLVLALVRFGEVPCVLVGQDRYGKTSQQALSPVDLRQARRGIRLAQELDFPLVTVIDTAGAALSKEAEEDGLAGEIARCLSELVTLRTPTVSLLLGQGSGGGALAMLPADRVLAAKHGWLAPLPPEGASAIIHRDVTHASDMAFSQKVGAADLYAAGIVHAVISECSDAADEPIQFCERVGGAVHAALTTLIGQLPEKRLADRIEHFKRIGEEVGATV
ncbi:carboxyl transferase domain-containing protein [Rhodococcus qingshengii]|uniref:carboxyl transferase domain-containing protein n=1 Tax=Rhodococcus qingshengii TaxID=334542 RepID=UPI0036DCC125